MTYEELVEMWNVDAKIDPDKLDSESLGIPYIQGKYFNFYLRERAVLYKHTLDLNKLKRWKKDYFMGGIPPEELAEKGLPVNPILRLKTEVDEYVNVDPDVIGQLGKIAVVQMKVDFLKLCVDSLNGRQWLIKNTIEFLKFKHGIL